MQVIQVGANTSLKVFASILLISLSILTIYLVREFWLDIRLILIIFILIGIKYSESNLIAGLYITKKQIILNYTSGKRKIQTNEIKMIYLTPIRPNDGPVNYEVIRFLLKNNKEIVYPAKLGRSQSIRAADVQNLTGIRSIKQSPIRENEARKKGYLKWEFWL